MIRRTEDFSSLSTNVLNKIAEVVNKKENKKLYDSYNDANEAHVVAAELRVKGYQTDVYKNGNKFQVYTTNLESISLKEAEDSGQFKKLAWGRYCFQRESAIGMFDFNFNDGSIWKVSQDENGNTVLIKEVDDENEDEVIRSPIHNNTSIKTAGLNKQTFVTENNFLKVAEMFYGTQNNEFIDLILSSDQKNSIVGKLDEKFHDTVNVKIANCQISDEKEIDEIKSLIASTLNDEIKSLDTLDVLLNKFVQNKNDKLGQQRKYFN